MQFNTIFQTIFKYIHKKFHFVHTNTFCKTRIIYAHRFACILLYTCDNQFGFKSKHSAELCIYTLKEFIDHYKQRGTTVFVTFLDASKAFDKINYWLLKKYSIKVSPHLLLKFDFFWYTHQEMHVRWGITVTSSFLVSNGVKQGAILSPMLFNV